MAKANKPWMTRGGKTVIWDTHLEKGQLLFVYKEDWPHTNAIGLFRAVQDVDVPLDPDAIPGLVQAGKLEKVPHRVMASDIYGSVEVEDDGGWALKEV